MKKDPDYIAAVERAITEKYGKNTVQDFRNEWNPEKEKDYLFQLKQRTRSQDKKRKKSTHSQDERTCPVCKTYSFSAQDDLYMVRYQCCKQCYVEYISPTPAHEMKWKSGWRPEPTEVMRRQELRRKK